MNRKFLLHLEKVLQIFFLFIITVIFALPIWGQITTFPQSGYIIISEDPIDPDVDPCKDIISLAYQQDEINAYFKFTVNCDNVGFNNNRFFIFIDSDKDGNSDYLLWMNNPQQILLYAWNTSTSQWEDTGSTNTGFEDPNATPDDHIFMGVGLSDINMTDGAGIGASAAPANFKLDTSCREPACQGFLDTSQSGDIGVGNPTLSTNLLCDNETIISNVVILDSTCYRVNFDWQEPSGVSYFNDDQVVSGSPAGASSSTIPAIAGNWNLVITYFNNSEQQLPISTTFPETDTLPFTVLETPSVSFNISPNPGIVGEAVQFSEVISGGTGPYSLWWTFGDGGTSSASNPQHTFTSEDLFSITLEVTDSNGCVKTSNQELSVIFCCTPTAEVTNLIVNRSGLNNILSWTAISDPCHVSYTIYRGTTPSILTIIDDTTLTTYTDTNAFSDVFYKVGSQGCGNKYGPY